VSESSSDSAVVRVLGIRHHGPGSARAVSRALEQLQPDCVLIEGPAELTDVVALASSDDLQPPVAGFVYLDDSPRFAVFDPFAIFSPEWIAMQHGVRAKVPVRFIDLPASHELVERSKAAEEAQAALAEYLANPPEPADELADTAPLDESVLDDEIAPDDGAEIADTDLADDALTPEPEPSLAARVRRDPIGTLAEIAGYNDGEAWWDDVVEHQGVRDGADDSAVFEMFAMLSEAMRELRAEVDAAERVEGTSEHRDYERNERREAAMRTAIRTAQKEGYARIAVVCGAWHAPALELLGAPPATADAARLKGLNKGKVTATWVPWTHRRLGYASGYGAGVVSPGWYHHVFETSPHGPNHVVTSWLVGVARLLREEGLDASPASVIESVRLAKTLASMRGRPLAGLPELDDAILAVLAQGSNTVFSLVQERMAIGDRLGSVPESTPMVPLARDLAQLQKKFRLKVSAVEEVIDLDLRKPNDLVKSHLLHRLALLDIDWGVQQERTGRTTGTFHELWAMSWRPELAVAIVEASLHGTTIEAASTALTIERSKIAKLDGLTGQIENVLLADLPLAIDGVLSALRTQVAIVTDIGALMDAIGPLARVARYGDVRRTDATAVRSVLDGLLVRICAGLGGACASLDDDAAQVFLRRINDVHAAVGLVDDEDNRVAWAGTLERLAAQDSVHGLLSGRVVRILADSGVFTRDQTATALSLALSRGAAPDRSAWWVEGFLSGNALLLLHDRTLLGMIDEWVTSVDVLVFDDLIPLLRRTFATLNAMERRMIGNAVVQQASGAGSIDSDPVALHTERAALVVPRFLQLIGAGMGVGLGVSHD
jgi:hypothetical protein